jgi:hypothetical protein
MSVTTPPIPLTVAPTGKVVDFVPERLVIAGYTGRDRAVVEAHIDELAAIGIPAPPHVPMFYEIPHSLLTNHRAIAVTGARTSGEVEPVLFSTANGVYVGLGSDHTDRDVERRDIGESKASAQKPVGSHVVELESVREHWDDVVVSCTIDGVEYQRDRLSALLPPSELVAAFAAEGGQLRPGTAMFCGTVPLIDHTFVFGRSHRLRLVLPGGTELRHEYDVTVIRPHANNSRTE